jgi:replicative DNA helicase
MMFSFELELKVLTGLLQHPHKWAEISSFITDDDFFSEDSKFHISIFKIIRKALNNAEAINDTILIDRIKNLNISFPDSIDPEEYIRAMQYFPIEEKVFENSVRELKKYTLRRKGLDISRQIERFVTKMDTSQPYSTIVEGMDKIYNDTIRTFELGENKVVDLAEMAEELVEERGENPPEEIGFMSPYPTINKIYGSLLRPGNMVVFAARAKAGKTSIMLDFLLKTSYKYKVPVLHFDNGEMSEEELIFRMVSGMSGVPMHLLESGKWRTCGYKNWNAEEVVERVRGVWKQMKGIKILYENVAGMSPEEMISLLKRIYYSQVGRGNPMIFSFDYIKIDYGSLGKGSEHNYVGKMINSFKQAIHRDLKFDGKACVSMATSVQTNRTGIIKNKDSKTVVDDESSIALSDDIIRFASHTAILRQKTIDELVDEGEEFGTHKLIFRAARHLGEDPFGHLNPVRMEDGSLRDNFINLQFDSFNVEDRGDLRDIVAAKMGDDVQPRGDDVDDDDLPEALR